MKSGETIDLPPLHFSIDGETYRFDVEVTQEKPRPPAKVIPIVPPGNTLEPSSDS